MYICDFCNELQKPGKAVRSLVTQTRPKTYFDKRGNTTSVGFETAVERKACNTCYTEARDSVASERQIAKELVLSVNLGEFYGLSLDKNIRRADNKKQYRTKAEERER